MPLFPLTFPFTGGGSIMEYIADHATSAKNRLAQQYRNKPNLAGLLDAFNAQTQAVEDAFWALLNQRGVATATGAQLDILGAIVGQARGGMVDDDYRLWITARIRLNKSSATPEDILNIFSLVKPSGTTLTLKDEPPAAFTLVVGGAASTSTNLVRFLRLAKAAGVRAILQWMESDPAVVFTLDGTSAQALDNGLFAGATV